MSVVYRPVTAFSLLLSVCLAAPVTAETLLSGTVEDGGSEKSFSLSAEDRDDVIGGQISIDDQVFTIDKKSRLGLFGAQRQTEQGKEFAVFSSSFSNQTATGQPWVDAGRYLSCDEPYNTFIAIYRVDTAALGRLSGAPYPALTKNQNLARESVVYCFVSRPPESSTSAENPVSGTDSQP